MNQQTQRTDDDLDILDPPSVEVTLNGRPVTIRPLTVGQIPAFARAIRPLGDLFQRIESLTTADVLDMLADHGEQVIEAAAVATGLQGEDLQDVNPGEFVSLVAAVIRVNADFFRRALTAGRQAPQPQGQ